MLVYQPSRVSMTYQHTANPPRLDKIAVTIDHVHAGNSSVCSTYELVRYLVHRNIPVTVFIQATSPGNNYELDKTNARLIHQLNHRLVTLGVHPLSRGHSQVQQLETFNVISQIIQEATGSKPKVLSYHGHRAGPEAGIIYPGIQYARGIHSQDGRAKAINTPVMPASSVTNAFNYIKRRNEAGLSATFFTHSVELKNGSAKKRVFDNLVKQVMAQRLHAMPYIEAMQQDFNGATATNPASNQNRNRPQQPPSPGAKFGLRLSALTEVSFRPVNANFEVRDNRGDIVAVTNNRKQAQFHLPPAIYQANARVDGVSITQLVNLTGQQGIHQKFLFPAV